MSEARHAVAVAKVPAVLEHGRHLGHCHGVACFGHLGEGQPGPLGQLGDGRRVLLGRTRLRQLGPGGQVGDSGLVARQGLGLGPYRGSRAVGRQLDDLAALRRQLGQHVRLEPAHHARRPQQVLELPEVAGPVDLPDFLVPHGLTGPHGLRVPVAVALDEPAPVGPETLRVQLMEQGPQLHGAVQDGGPGEE
jgi:hypothetical protein